MNRGATLTLTLSMFLAPALLQAAAPEPRGLGDPGKLTQVVIETGRPEVVLAGPDAWQQLLVTGKYATGQERDLTRTATFQAAPAGIVAVDRTGLVTPLQDGVATITVTAPGAPAALVQVTVAHLAQEQPVQFATQIVPIFTKLGCNAGGCHGKASGQNGFKLSLFGFEPAEDYDSLVKEARGRRLFPASPAHSLLLLKATGTVPHAGGKKMTTEAATYRSMLRWSRQGAPRDLASSPSVRRIEVFPKERLMDRDSQQQLTVVAHLSDGTTRDVTRLALFDSNQLEMAEVTETGLVSTLKLPGSVAIMARFQEHAEVFRATVPLGADVASMPPPRNFVDELVFKQLKKLGLPPSETCDDGTFIRRATIDIAGRLPTREETQAFVASQDAHKHAKLIDALLESKDYANYFANKWGSILRNRRRAPNEDPRPTVAFHEWIRASLQENKPYDEIVRGVLTATGAEVETPPVIWYREVKEMTAQVEDVAQLFLGQHVACARCHHHPFEKWSQDDYWSLAAFFARVEVKEPPPAKGKPKKGVPPAAKAPLTVSHKAGLAQAINPRTNLAVLPKGLGGQAVPIGQNDDPRRQLVDWMVAKDNPFFARSLVNRYWKHFFSRGLVDPEDDLRLTNPASNPELLAALAQHFIDSKFDLKQLVRTICTSQVYRLSAVPNAFNADDRQNFSRYLPKRLNAEVLLDAIDDVTLTRTTFKGVPAGTRAVQLPDNQVESYFLSVFGRPDAASACECERTSDASLAQCLHMFNSAELLAKTSGTRAKQLAGDKRPHDEKLRELYWTALAREPSKEELANLLAHLEKKGDAQSGYEDIIWALVNTKEFLFNH